MDDNQIQAVEAYELKTGRVYVPGDYEELPIDALVFTDHQTVWTTLEDFKKLRCVYDQETNEWLVHYIEVEMLDPGIPPVYVDIHKEGVSLVDGAHRVSAHMIKGHETILVQLNKE